MSTKLDSHLWRTSGRRDQVATDPLYPSLEWSPHRDPTRGGPQRLEEESFRWNRVAPLISFVFFDLARNLLVMRAHIRPCVCKIFSAQCWICLQKVGLTCSKPPRPLEEPYRNPRAHNAGLTSTNVSTSLNSGKSVSNITRRPLQQLCLFGAAQFAEQLFSLFQNAHIRCQSAALWVRMQADLS
jgi:hypothetical protein